MWGQFSVLGKVWNFVVFFKILWKYRKSWRNSMFQHLIPLFGLLHYISGASPKCSKAWSEVRQLGNSKKYTRNFLGNPGILKRLKSGKLLQHQRIQSASWPFRTNGEMKSLRSSVWGGSIWAGEWGGIWCNQIWSPHKISKFSIRMSVMVGGGVMWRNQIWSPKNPPKF